MASSALLRNGQPVVLLVEGNDAVRNVMAEAFEAAGMRVEHAVSREAALRIIRRVSPDVIVLERHLPDGDGWQVVGDLRRRGTTELVVIAITSNVALTSAERALVAGCDAFLETPCDPEIVVAEAVRCLAARSPTTAVRRRPSRDS